jgi:hypothetical protein
MNFTPIIHAVVFDGLILAVLAIAALAVVYVTAKYGSISIVSFVSRMVGNEQVLVGKDGKYGYWDRDVYDQAMRDLNAYRHSGGRLDRESQEALDSWNYQRWYEETH